jgi:hypothetical protein
MLDRVFMQRLCTLRQAQCSRARLANSEVFSEASGDEFEARWADKKQGKNQMCFSGEGMGEMRRLSGQSGREHSKLSGANRWDLAVGRTSTAPIPLFQFANRILDIVGCAAMSLNFWVNSPEYTRMLKYCTNLCSRICSRIVNTLCRSTECWAKLTLRRLIQNRCQFGTCSAMWCGC